MHIKRANLRILYASPDTKTTGTVLIASLFILLFSVPWALRGKHLNQFAPLEGVATDSGWRAGAGAPPYFSLNNTNVTTDN